MLTPGLDEGLVGALDDALAADVDPRSGGHLAVHHQALALELVEVIPIGPMGHQVGVGDQHPRRVGVGPEDSDRLARLDQQGLVAIEGTQSLDDLVEAVPIARRLADAAVDHQFFGILGNLAVQVVHDHAERGFGKPAFGGNFGAARGAHLTNIAGLVSGHRTASP